jgi:hypothetical protein
MKKLMYLKSASPLNPPRGDFKSGRNANPLIKGTGESLRKTIDLDYIELQ